jgi:hypothetical protein
VPPSDQRHPPPRKSVIAKLLAALFNHITVHNDYPDVWCTAIITALYKGKGACMDPNNYRGIAVQCALAKCYAITLEKRISSFLEDRKLRAPMQAGFRKVVGTHYNGFVLKHLQARFCHPLQPRISKPCYVCLVDFAKAFDKVTGILFGIGCMCLVWMAGCLKRSSTCTCRSGCV